MTTVQKHIVYSI